MDAVEQNVDLTGLPATYQGQWVVMSRQTRKVIACDKDPARALKKATDLGCKDPILHKVMPFDKGFISLS